MMKKNFSKFSIFLLIFNLFCGGGKEVLKFSEISLPHVDMKAKKIPINIGLLKIGEEKGFVFTITNNGVGRALVIEDISLDYKPVTEEEKKGGSALRLKHNFNFPIFVAPKNEGKEMGYPEEVEFSIIFKRYNDNEMRKGKLLIINNSNSPKDEALKNLEIEVFTIKSAAKIEVNPKLLDFGIVKKGQTPQKEITVLNNGASPLIIDSFSFAGNKNFSVFFEDKEYNVSEKTKKKLSFEKPLKIDALGKYQIKVKYTPKTGEAATSYLILYSNDPDEIEGTKIDIQANITAPCMKIVPDPVDFGPKKVAQTSMIDVKITSCGDSTLEIYKVKLIEGSSPDFGIDYSSFPDGKEPSEKEPLTIDTEQSIKFKVSYTPPEKNPLDVEGKPIPDSGHILFVNNTFDMEYKLKLTGIGVEVVCPVAKILIKEGEEVKPQTILHLYGDQSEGGSGAVKKWFWGVEQPEGSFSTFFPQSNFNNPTFEVNIAGVYTFSLDVEDEAGKKSSDPDCKTVAVKKVVVIPDEAIHIELLWNTPNDPDPTDEGPEAGSDMDVHFLHPYASGPDLDGDGKPDGWFDTTYDCFWFNPNPDWASASPMVDDNPSLDRDDTDGAGPENINLNAAEDGKTYRVGVHYWDDHGFGKSEATIRIYIWKQLVEPEVKIWMYPLDMCEIAEIKWPSGEVIFKKEQNGKFKCTPDYVNPNFINTVSEKP